MKALREIRNIRPEQLAQDFKNLDPNDPGLWPLLPRVSALLGILAAILVLAWWFDWKNQSEDFDQRVMQQAQLKDEWLSKKRQAVNLDEYKRQLTEIDRQFGALLKQLPSKTEMENLLIDVNQAGLGRGLQFELWKPNSESPKDFYAELPIAIRLTGTYHDLGNFVGDIAKLPRIVTLNDIAIEVAKDGNLKMDALAVTYRYLDEQEIAKQKKEKAAKAKAGGGK
ncbi:type 4a pilus biogenesis protein PilO [Niveibacterium microcysteis]|uniref:Type 4a pilus biogenesis protein PilO n=1 Tax=Niveibacterium microcysteis TaxID=2811415 RepID=A0ABX7MC62_9RHOO|nr:type 4a pilus biogenesis protein PilO [Niveibacterium microcysteis]QSI79312.1 type 4a pilus biogenesis protein PilO [Niveibacterium microcysteis]